MRYGGASMAGARGAGLAGGGSRGFAGGVRNGRFAERCELEVLSLVPEGLTDRGIGEPLDLSPKTVKAHVRSNS